MQTTAQIHQKILEAISTTPNYPTEQFSGKGIVTTAYDLEYASAYVLLSELARLGNLLPVEVFYKAGELNPIQKKILTEFGPNVKLMQLSADVTGFAIKPFAIYESSFQEILWIDADNAPVLDPVLLFDDPYYLKKGSLFWKDIGSTRPSVHASAWEMFGVLKNDSDEFETGQLLLDKKRNWSELWLTLFFNKNKDLFYKHIHGDKDTFRFAWQLLQQIKSTPNPPIQYQQNQDNLPYGLIPFVPFHVGNANEASYWGGGKVLAQRNRFGEVVFNHRTLCKLRAGHINEVQRQVINEHIYHLHLKNLETKLRYETSNLSHGHEMELRSTPIALLHIATGEYLRLTDDFIRSSVLGLEEHYRKIIFVFSDEDYIPKPHIESNPTIEIINIKIQQEIWPYNTLRRFEYFENAKRMINSFNPIAIFFANANAAFIAANPLEEMLKKDKSLAFVNHPAFYQAGNKPFETNSNSVAYVPPGQRSEIYVQGFFYGGLTEEFWKLNKNLADSVKHDLNDGIMAIWHDESYLNMERIKSCLNTGIVLDPGFAFPEGWNLPFFTKILSRDKSKYFSQVKKTPRPL